ncbi:MAG: IMP cyclohydrolase [Oscillospiraceae bacterium]|nr:IMP cyclohydrolase [Oscillospiraceae bacterium]
MQEFGVEQMESLTTLLASNPYPGRGIAVGLTPDGKNAALGYFVLGRSERSRNRVLVEQGDAIVTRAIDDRLVGDPSLILYKALAEAGGKTILTNGAQTDTIAQYLNEGSTFEEALRTWDFEPDPPHYTPRISALVSVEGGLRYRLALLRNRAGTTLRSFFEYEGIPGEGHFIHTYLGDGYPLPSFEGEPFSVSIMNDMEDWTHMLWHALHPENRVALLTRFIPLNGEPTMTRIVNAAEAHPGSGD